MAQTKNLNRAGVWSRPQPWSRPWGQFTTCQTFTPKRSRIIKDIKPFLQSIMLKSCSYLIIKLLFYCCCCIVLDNKIYCQDVKNSCLYYISLFDNHTKVIIAKILHLYVYICLWPKIPVLVVIWFSVDESYNDKLKCSSRRSNPLFVSFSFPGAVPAFRTSVPRNLCLGTNRAMPTPAGELPLCSFQPGSWCRYNHATLHSPVIIIH